MLSAPNKLGGFDAATSDQLIAYTCRLFQNTFSKGRLQNRSWDSTAANINLLR